MQEILSGFEWFSMVSGGFGWFAVLVLTAFNESVSLKQVCRFQTLIQIARFLRFAFLHLLSEFMSKDVLECQSTRLDRML